MNGYSIFYFVYAQYYCSLKTDIDIFARSCNMLLNAVAIVVCNPPPKKKDVCHHIQT